MELPERTVAVEVGAREFRDQGLELRLAAQAPAAARARVAIEMKSRVRLPVRAERILARAAPEPREGEETLLDRAAEAPEFDRRIEHDDPDDHHQVGRAIHPQPRGIDRGHSFRFAGHRITVKHMAYFVTGATGFIGRYLVERLLARGDRVFVLVRPAIDGEVRGAARILGRARGRARADRRQPRGAEPRRLQVGPAAAHRQGRPPVPPGGDVRPAGDERGAGPREHRRHRPCAAVRGLGAGGLSSTMRARSPPRASTRAASAKTCSRRRPASSIRISAPSTSRRHWCATAASGPGACTGPASSSVIRRPGRSTRSTGPTTSSS